MKKLLFLAFICLLGFYACKKSDSDNNSTKITGKWSYTKAVLIKKVNNTDSVAKVDADVSHSQYMQFNKDGTFVSNGTNVEVTGKYTLSGSTLSLIADGYTETYIVKTLTSESLVLRNPYGYINNGGSYYNEYYYSK